MEVLCPSIPMSVDKCCTVPHFELVSATSFLEIASWQEGAITIEGNGQGSWNGEEAPQLWGAPVPHSIENDSRAECCCRKQETVLGQAACPPHPQHSYTSIDCCKRDQPLSTCMQQLCFSVLRFSNSKPATKGIHCARVCAYVHVLGRERRERVEVSNRKEEGQWVSCSVWLLRGCAVNAEGQAHSVSVRKMLPLRL